MPCGGATTICTHRSRCNGSQSVTIQWARTPDEYHSHMRQVHERYHISPELWYAPGLNSRWEVMKHILHKSRARSVLDVGGIDRYSAVVARYRCINVRRAGRCVRYEPGKPLPYSNASFELTMAETVLHHAAQHAEALLAEMVRTSMRYVLVAEDILETERVSKDVSMSFRRHDSHAIYRSLAEWMALASALGLQASRIFFLHRVPLHVLREAPRCELGYAPMAYLLFERVHAAPELTRPQWSSATSWHALRAREEEDAGLNARYFGLQFAQPGDHSFLQQLRIGMHAAFTVLMQSWAGRLLLGLLVVCFAFDLLECFFCKEDSKGSEVDDETCESDATTDASNESTPCQLRSSSPPKHHSTKLPRPSKPGDTRRLSCRTFLLDGRPR